MATKQSTPVGFCKQNKVCDKVQFSLFNQSTMANKQSNPVGFCQQNKVCDKVQSNLFNQSTIPNKQSTPVEFCKQNKVYDKVKSNFDNQSKVADKQLASVELGTQNKECGKVQSSLVHQYVPEEKVLFDIRCNEGDNFVNSIIFSDQRKVDAPIQCEAYDQWKVQSGAIFGFIPLTDPILPVNTHISDKKITDPIELHKEVKKHNLPNQLGSRIPVQSQMNIKAWKSFLKGYWDKQFLECLEFGFPLGFNRLCTLSHDKKTHKSALQFPGDVIKYIQEEQSFGDIG